MITNEQIKNLCSRLRLYALPRLLESEAHLAQEQGKKHVEFLHDLLSREVQERDSKDFQRRLKAAALPARHDLDLFDHNYSQGITAPRLRELRRLGWLEQNYNLILMGPSGTGKAFIAAGLVYEAVGQGYKVYGHDGGCHKHHQDENADAFGHERIQPSAQSRPGSHR